jgi:hypothetical protein
MPSFTEMREALRSAMPDDVVGEVATGPQEASKTFGGTVGPPRMLVRAYVGAPGDPAAQKRLDELLDPDAEGCVPDCLLGSEEVGAVCGRIQIVSASGWRIYETKDGPVLGAEWTVQTS